MSISRVLFILTVFMSVSINAVCATDTKIAEALIEIDEAIEHYKKYIDNYEEHCRLWL